jgi:type IV pilus assembly protein PilM
VPISFQLLAPKSSLRPRLACEIAPEGVIAARQSDSGEAVMSFSPLPAGMVKPGLGEANIIDHPRVVLGLREALDEVAGRDKQLTLVIPDAAVRVLVMDFDTLPAKKADALPIVRFRLKKLATFEVDDAAVSYQVMQQTHNSSAQTRVLATVMPATIRAEYEDAVRSAGYEPGVVLPSTLASLATLASDEPSLVINRNGRTLTTAITRGNELLLHRTLELPTSDQFHHEELAKTVSVAMAYFEDTLQARPRVLHYVGPGGAQEFANVLEQAPGHVLNEYGLQVRDLVAGPGRAASNKMPQGMAAGVVGALAS